MLLSPHAGIGPALTRGVSVKSRVLAALATAVLVLGIAPPAGAVPVTELKPKQLDRGDDVKLPHLEGKTVVDGDVEIPFKSGAVRLLGKSGDDYVVGLSNKDGTGRFRTVRVTPAGDRTLLFRDVPIWELELASDGNQVAAVLAHRRHTRIRVHDATTGSLDASRRFDGFVSVLDLENGRLVAGSWSPDKTFSWNVVTDRTRRVSKRIGYAADLSADRLATYTKDPYNGGCSIVSSLTDPGQRLWRSCGQRVDTFSPSGGRVATIPILSDGIGPAEVWLHRIRGKVLAHYAAAWFGPLSWESDRTLLLQTNGWKKSAMVRCVLATCERASALESVPSFRVRPAAPGPRSLAR
jgi:hypothetical protein